MKTQNFSENLFGKVKQTFHSKHPAIWIAIVLTGLMLRLRVGRRTKAKDKIALNSKNYQQLKDIVVIESWEYVESMSM